MMLRTLLFIPFLFLSFASVNAQSLRGDSLMLKEFYLYVQDEYYGEEEDLSEDNLTFDSTYLDQDLDYEGASIHHSPDGMFYILIVEGEGCGAYCNPWWASRIVSSSLNKTYDECPFTNIQAIHRMPDGKYLVIQSSYGRPASVYTVEGRRAHLISFENDELEFHRIAYKYPRGGENTDKYEKGAIIFEQEHFISNDIFIEYDESQQTLKYQYGRNYLFCCQEDSTFIYSGQFKYNSGSFVHEFENEEFKGTSEDDEY